MSDDDEGIIVEELADLYDIEQAVAQNSEEPLSDIQVVEKLDKWVNYWCTPPIPKSLTEIGVYAKWV